MVEEAVSDEQMANAHYRFPAQTPQNKEEFYYRSIFEEHFPSEAAALCVPSVPLACSTPIALEWDEAFKNMNDPAVEPWQKSMMMPTNIKTGYN